MLARLVGFDTTSAKSNLEFIGYVQRYLEGLGAVCVRVEDGEKAGLVGVMGPADVAGGVVLSGHTDVVPVKGQAWASEPFVLKEDGGRLYGRGSCDMKGFIAAALEVAAGVDAAALVRPLWFAFSWDEEVGCLGVRKMLAPLEKVVRRPVRVIVGEPTMMEVVSAHKSLDAFQTRVQGVEAHSSQTHIGRSALVVGAKMVGWLEERAEALRLVGGGGKFSPAYTTLNVGVMHAGEAVNIVPGRCVFDWETRCLPGVKAAEAVLDDFVAYGREVEQAHEGITVETVPLVAVPGFREEQDSEAVALALQVSGRNSTSAASYVTEAGLFQEAGYDVVLCGPGSIEQAHKPDEYVAVDQLAACEVFLRQVVGGLRG